MLALIFLSFKQQIFLNLSSNFGSLEYIEIFPHWMRPLWICWISICIWKTLFLQNTSYDMLKRTLNWSPISERLWILSERTPLVNCFQLRLTYGTINFNFNFLKLLDALCYFLCLIDSSLDKYKVFGKQFSIIEFYISNQLFVLLKLYQLNGKYPNIFD
jgi:hypothetical protein